MKRLVKKGKILLLLALVMVLTNLIGSPTSSDKPDRNAPAEPANLKVVAVTSMSVSLAWTKSTDNVGVTEYYVYKDNVYIGKSNTTAFSVSGLTPEKSYQFYVRARDAAGNLSKNSNTLTVEALAAPVPAPATTATPAPAVSTRRMIGYYADWAAHLGYTPDKIDAGKLTHINYAFANIGSNLKIALGYPDVDISNISKLNALKQINPKLKTLISVGGWSWSDKFSDAAHTDVSRTIFADSCVAFIVKYGFNGIDIDWEYPVSGGMPQNVRRPEDKRNFTLLLKKLREKLNARSQLDGKKYLLTIAGGNGSWYADNVELGLIHQYLDYANVMTYDIHGMWDEYTDFNAPLYDNDGTPQEKWSVDSAVKAWLDKGFPPEKLIVGVPFYGYKYSSVNNVNNGLYQIFSKGLSINYSNIAANYLNTPGYVRHYNKQSMVPWLFNGSTFISYEDEQSIGLKAQYIKSKGLGGAAIWELSQDPGRVLFNTLYKGLQ